MTPTHHPTIGQKEQDPMAKARSHKPPPSSKLHPFLFISSDIKYMILAQSLSVRESHQPRVSASPQVSLGDKG